MTVQDVAPINGALLRRQREARGWSLSDVATRACMSIKQIRQIEDGGVSAFYSEAVKQTSAKKVGVILGMQPEAVFGVDVVAPPVTELSFVTAHEADELLAVSDGILSADSEQVNGAAAALASTEDAVQSEAASPSADAAAEASSEPARTRNSWGLIAVLFLAAIALAAVLRPQQEPPVATDPPPTLSPASQGDPVEPAASSAAAPSDGSVAAPVETPTVATPAPAASQPAPAMPPAPAAATSAAKPN